VGNYTHAMDTEPPPQKRSKPTLVMLVIVWIIWIFLFLGWPTDLLVTMMKDSSFDMKLSGNEDSLSIMLAYVGFILLALSFAIRWFVFGFLIQEKRIKPGTVMACVVGIIGTLIVFAMTKSVEIYGLTLFLRGDPGSLLEQLIFWVPSLIVFIIHLLGWMIPKRIARA